ncbi:MAG: HAD family phosphatase [Chloroflexota bacterium]|nr:MAG: hydrolase [Chloroflexota bacterium]
MPIRAAVFDIGGVLEITPRTGWVEAWETRLNLRPGEIERRLGDVWRAGGIGRISEAGVVRSIQRRLELDHEQLAAFIDDMWAEYLGSLNVELADYFRGLRPRYRTAIISNSFVGAREREQQRYQLDTICDFIIYSHEVGLEKPDRRIFELACERLGVQPGEAIFLDDVEPYVAAAREVGMVAIHFRSTAQAIAEIEACLHAAAS